MYEANKANLLGRVMLFLVIIASYRVSLGIAPACAESVPASKAEVDALKNDLKSINSSLESIQKELEFIRQLLTQRPSQPRQPAPTIANVSLSGNPMLGNKDAPITLTRLWPFRNRPSADQQGRAGTVRKLGEVW
jgi:hypothetical protein